LLKAAGLLGLVLVGFLWGQSGAVDGMVRDLHWTKLPSLIAVVAALQGVIYTYDGWYYPIYFGEEVRDPARTIPRSMIGGVVLVIVIYLLINFALLAVLPVSQIAGQPLALATAAESLFGPQGGKAVGAVGILIILGALNASILIAPRILYAMSRDGLFIQRAAAVNVGGTPTVALLLSTLVALAFIPGNTYEQVLAVMAFFFVFNYLTAYAAVFWLRWREPGAARPYRAWGFPWTTGLALMGSLAFLAGAIASDTENSRYALVWLGASLPAFLVLRLLGRGGPREAADA
jgi:APA family basic amino acid/polyamine antiporter